MHGSVSWSDGDRAVVIAAEQMPLAAAWDDNERDPDAP